VVKVEWNGKDWISLPAGSENGMYLDGYLQSNLNFIRQDIRNDSDAVIIVSGKERAGKSVCAMQVAKYLDPSLTLDRVTFTPAEFRKAVLSANKFECVVFDEAITGLRAQRWASEVNQSLIEMLAQIGQKNLCIIVVIPSFFELGKYVAIHRSVALLHVYRKNGQRGFFAAYNLDRQTRLYILGRKTYDYSVSRPNFIGRFMNYYPLDEAEYRKKKLESLSKPQQAIDGSRWHTEASLQTQRNALIQFAHELGASHAEISAAASVGKAKISKTQVSRILREVKENIKISGGDG